MLAPFLGLPKQSEILIIIFVGICFLSLDFSLFEIKSNLEKVWNLQLNEAKSWETILKYIITVVILARTVTLHAFVACYIVMLWPAIFEEKPNLMVPWLLLGILRSLILNFITIAVGTFICNKEKGFSPICIEYIAAQVIEHGPSLYSWLSVLSFYKDLVGEQASDQSRKVSLPCVKSTISAKCTDKEEIQDDDPQDIIKSYSLSDLNLEYMSSSRLRMMYVNMLADEILEDLSHLVSRTRHIQDTSKSSNSLDQDKCESFEIFETFYKNDLDIKEKAIKILGISEQDIANAQQDKHQSVKILKEVKPEDVNKIDEKLINKIASQSFYIRKGKVRKGKTYLKKSLSLHEEAENRDSCLYYIRKKLERDESKLALLESEIANIQFEEIDKNGNIEKIKGDKSNSCTNPKPEYSIKSASEMSGTKIAEPKKYVTQLKSIYEEIGTNYIKNDIPNGLNRYRVVVGAGSRLNNSNFLQKSVMKKNTSKNFGCQVSLWKKSFCVGPRNEFRKKFAVLRNSKLL